MSRDHTPVVFNKFMGLWARNPVESCPQDHFISCQNNAFTKGGGVKQRPGFNQLVNFGAPLARIGWYQTRNEVDALGTISYARNLVQLASGGLFDYFRFPGSPALQTVAAGSLFSIASIFNRAYISFRNPPPASTALNDSVYVYNGIHPVSGGIYRAIAGAPIAPGYGGAVVGGPYVGNNATIIFGIAHEMDTGYIIPPSTYHVRTAGAGQPDPNFWGNPQYNFTFGVGPAGTVARHIIASKAITGVYSGNPTDYPLYRVHRIPDNVTVNFNFSTSGIPPNYSWDNYLNVTADDLINQLNPVKGGINLIEYNGRLVILGPYDDKNLIRVSKSGEPESFSATSGFKITDLADPTGVKNGVVYNKNLYLFKSRRTLVTRDNGDEVSTWDIETVDPAIGTGPLGVAPILAHKGAAPEGFLVAAQGGIYLFNGVYQKPELTYKIEDYWLRINNAYFDQVELVLDPVAKLIYCAVPLDANTSPNVIIVGDYSEGLDPKTIKWSEWQILGTSANAGIVIYDTPSAAPLPVTVMGVGNYMVFKDTSVGVDLGGTVFDSNMILKPIRPFPGISHFNKFGIRAYGAGSLNVRTYTKDGASFSDEKVIGPLTTSGYDRDFLINHKNEECRIRIAAVGTPDYDLRYFELYHKPLWMERPR